MNNLEEPPPLGENSFYKKNLVNIQRGTFLIKKNQQICQGKISVKQMANLHRGAISMKKLDKLPQEGKDLIKKARFTVKTRETPGRRIIRISINAELSKYILVLEYKHGGMKIVVGGLRKDR